MKRLHVHVGVDNLDASVTFYSTLFAAEPTVLKPDYAKWLLDDPQVNFAISARGRAAGVDHLGIQVEDDGELRDIALRLRAADRVVVERTATACCYANSDKAWVADPQGLAWETFLTHGDATVYGDDSVETDETTRAELSRVAPLSAACCDRPTPRPTP